MQSFCEPLSLFYINEGGELLYPFVKEWIISKDTTPSAADYFQWCSNVTDANYKLVIIIKVNNV